MNLLVDTHVLLWFLDGNKAISDEARELISQPKNATFVSAISLWEIIIKVQLGKLQSPSNIDKLVEKNGFELIDFKVEHAMAVQDLPLHHRDPFDRALIAVAKAENLIFLTVDRALHAYKSDAKIRIM